MFVTELLNSTRQEAGNMIDMVKSGVEKLADAVSDSVTGLERQASQDNYDYKPKYSTKDMEGDRSYLSSALIEVLLISVCWVLCFLCLNLLRSAISVSFG